MMIRTVEVDGARVAYRVAGDGPSVVLIKNNKHPLDFPVAQLLAPSFRTFQIQPVGFGASDRPARYDFGSIDRQVLAVLDAEDVGNFVVWGFSQTAFMAALVARATYRAVALVAGGADLLGHPSDADMRRLEREPRLPVSNLEFWRAYRRYDWHHELRQMEQPTLIYLGTDDPRLTKLRRLEPTLRGCGCDYLEFDGLDHTTSGLSGGADGGERTTSAITTWMRDNVQPDR
ncbi:alpha/beta hydrolase [Microlunatus elymi]|uniref:Alpha/beta hydrolase n=1 Tax=Microlunatus elymi TaxID=2596828 RepID=A0A516PW72_9ACTN|nr:alpha/beta fold hydrolase [Microlunatus elymi]QDP95436.1 alpha/beta hydrolase [Microlunatus elymi]